MKRFIDIRGQGTFSRFCWFDTGVGQIESHGDNTAWDTWADFAADYTGAELDRYRTLTPEWAFTDVTDGAEEACFFNNTPNPYGGAVP